MTLPKRAVGIVAAKKRKNEICAVWAIKAGWKL